MVIKTMQADTIAQLTRLHSEIAVAMLKIDDGSPALEFLESLKAATYWMQYALIVGDSSHWDLVRGMILQCDKQSNVFHSHSRDWSTSLNMLDRFVREYEGE